MDTVNNSQNAQSMGYLIVKVSTARGAIPLGDAAISIKGSSPESSGILYSLTSDRDGLSEKIALPAPPRSASQAPSDTAPYSLWSIDVFKDGYIPVSYQNVPVYASIVSVQPAIMVPVSENFSPRPAFSQSETPKL